PTSSMNPATISVTFTIWKMPEAQNTCVKATIFGGMPCVELPISSPLIGAKVGLVDPTSPLRAVLLRLHHDPVSLVAQSAEIEKSYLAEYLAESAQQAVFAGEGRSNLL